MRSFSSFGDEGHLYHRFLSDPGAVNAFYDTLKRSVHLEPEKRLMLALLDDALKCFQKHMRAKTRRRKKLFNEVERWFRERDDADVFSFEQVCAVLGLSSGYVRRMLAQRIAAAQSRTAVELSGVQPPGKARKRLRHAA